MGVCTVINCIDGRVQIPVITYLQKRFDVEYVDSVTEAGPNLILAKAEDDSLIQSILNRVNISVSRNKSIGLAIAGHYDCAANNASENNQIEHIKSAIKFLSGVYSNLEIIGLWVDEEWQVREITI